MLLSSPEECLHLITGHFHWLWCKSPDLCQRSPWGLLINWRKQATLHPFSSQVQKTNGVQQLFNLLPVESPIPGWQLQAVNGVSAQVSRVFSMKIMFGKQLRIHGNTIPTMVYRDWCSRQALRCGARFAEPLRAVTTAWLKTRERRVSK